MVNMKASVRFEPEGRKVSVDIGCTLLEASAQAGVRIRSECGGKGICGKCRVIIVESQKIAEISRNEREILSPTELGRGYRLACCTKVMSDLVVFVPSQSRIVIRRIQAEGIERPVKLEPAIKKYHLVLPKPTLQDIRPDFERVETALKQKGFKTIEIERNLLSELPEVLRRAEWNVTVTILDGRQIISVEEGNTENMAYGFAVDIGTSKIVGYLVDLVSGNLLSIKSMENPQIAYGEDVISRINCALTRTNALNELQKAVIKAINQLILDACLDANVKPEEIYEIVVVGNTAMHHIFLGIQPRGLVFAPYVPAIKRSINVKADSLKLKANKNAYIHVLPVIAGFVGADAIADVLATGIYEMDDVSLLMDVGTNGEIFVGNRYDLVCCSCAAGPAFEGMHIEFGMKAVTGAIEKIKINPHTYDVEYEVIGKAKPIGICGSGIIDAVAELFRCGIIDNTGKFKKDIKTKRLRMIGGVPKFVVAWKSESGINTHITISQKDIQEILLAKAAMHTGAEILMREKGLSEKDIAHVYVAGGFGRYINPKSAVIIGLIPDVPIEKISFVGNTAISGAKMALISTEIRKTAEKLSEKIRYIELMAHPDFRKEFISSLFIPHRNPNKYRSISRALGGC
jgi:uncharacterized 2Fe-2S/4Fe-4S cluster protein (DUF4445 family)